MPFARIGEQNEGDAWMSNGVPSMLLTGLAQTRGLEIVGTERLHDALKRRGGTSLASLDQGAAADRRLGTRALARLSLAASPARGRKSGSMRSSRTYRVAVSSSLTV